MLISYDCGWCAAPVAELRWCMASCLDCLPVLPTVAQHLECLSSRIPVHADTLRNTTKRVIQNRFGLCIGCARTSIDHMIHSASARPLLCWAARRLQDASILH